MTVSGLAASEMAMVYKNGQMVHSMRANGKTTELTAKENSLTSTETSMMENGLMIKLMVTESIIISTVLNTRVNGETICNMVKEKRVGLMDLCTKGNTWPVRSMEWVCIVGTTAPNTMESGMRIKSKVLVHTVG